MSENQILILMIIGCILIFGVYLFIKKKKALGIFTLRAFVGSLAVYILNITIGVGIGINPVTVMVIGIFGLPGILVLLMI